MDEKHAAELVRRLEVMAADARRLMYDCESLAKAVRGDMGELLLRLERFAAERPELIGELMRDNVPLTIATGPRMPFSPPIEWELVTSRNDATNAHGPSPFISAFDYWERIFWDSFLAVEEPRVEEPRVEVTLGELRTQLMPDSAGTAAGNPAKPPIRFDSEGGFRG